ncbi:MULTISPECIES: hypothetical protein [unclassified Neptuniibacter]|uniref:hypothetical protein n=1 Tax=unclassified Neptuniibacter TaxID=2630693 RepID=UPI000C3E5C58|nr:MULTISPECIES: hypothetical protein [unclassified Neptuniibacter]MAY42378.1 hypothetical protein [Oceanospirillaceae bacterium]|tara:strand:- start:4868 stop:5077 length:210 start_codon:yes stop_codon:yes gene_type:complete
MKPFEIEHLGGATGWLLAALFFALILVPMSGCSAVEEQPASYEPVPFKTGVKVEPLPGCVELRKRGGHC